MSRTTSKKFDFLENFKFCSRISRTQLSLLDPFWDEHQMGKVKNVGGGTGAGVGMLALYWPFKGNFFGSILPFKGSHGWPINQASAKHRLSVIFDCQVRNG